MRGPETERSHTRRTESGFYAKFMSGCGLDIGYRGSRPGAEPVLDSAIGIELDYPGYDGKTLPFPDSSQDYVFSSHVLEHLTDPAQGLREWFRVIRPGGYLVLMVPSIYLYEKKKAPPSRFNRDHHTFFTPGRLLSLIETTLAENSWRLRHMEDNDRGYDYSVTPDVHPKGAYEIECVIQKIVPPKWYLV